MNMKPHLQVAYESFDILLKSYLKSSTRMKTVITRLRCFSRFLNLRQFVRDVTSRKSDSRMEWIYELYAECIQAYEVELARAMRNNLNKWSEPKQWSRSHL